MAAGMIGLGRVDPEFEQAPHQWQRHVVALAGQQQRVASFAIDRADVRAAGMQLFEHADAAVQRGLQPRRAAVGIARFEVGAGLQQGGHDVAMPGLDRFVQGAAALAVARIDACAGLEQQLHAGGVVLVGAAAASNAGTPPVGSVLAPRSSMNLASRQLPAAQATPSGLKPS
jgi:hypothetical protein